MIGDSLECVIDHLDKWLVNGCYKDSKYNERPQEFNRMYKVIEMDIYRKFHRAVIRD